MRLDAVIGRKPGWRGVGRMQEEERPYFVDQVFLKFRTHAPQWMRSLTAMEKKDRAVVQAGES